jgi:hypothetical protein
MAPVVHEPSSLPHLSVPILARILQESNQATLTDVWQALGHQRCWTILQETLRIEQNGGMRIASGARRRTPGGVFFFLVRQLATPRERARLNKELPLLYAAGRQRNMAHVCGDKVRYKHRNAALTARVAILRTEGAGVGKALQAYHCRFCSWWHLGNRMVSRVQAEDQQQQEEDAP